MYKNYTQNIETSKEISRLEAEMYELGHVMHEYNQNFQSLSDMLASGRGVCPE